MRKEEEKEGTGSNGPMFDTIPLRRSINKGKEEMSSSSSSRISVQALSWVQNWTRFAKPELPSQEIARELSRFRPKQPIEGFRFVRNRELSIESKKKIISYFDTIETLIDTFDEGYSNFWIRRSIIPPEAIIVDVRLLSNYLGMDIHSAGKTDLIYGEIVVDQSKLGSDWLNEHSVDIHKNDLLMKESSLDLVPDGRDTEIFGKSLDDPNKKKPVGSPDPEPNTPVESIFLSVIRRQVGGGRIAGGKLGGLLLKHAREAGGMDALFSMYPELAPPRNKDVYRGMRVRVQDFVKLVNFFDGKEEKIREFLRTYEADNENVWYMAKKGMLMPKGEGDSVATAIGSWTLDPQVAADFAVGFGTEQKPDVSYISVIFVANTGNRKNKFFFNPDLIKQTYKPGMGNNFLIDEFGHEREVISVGPVEFEQCSFSGAAFPEVYYDKEGYKKKLDTSATTRLLNSIRSKKSNVFSLVEKKDNLATYLQKTAFI